MLHSYRGMKANQAMTREVFWIEPTDDLLLARELMSAMRIRHLPVVTRGRLIGIVSDRDVRNHATVTDGHLEVPPLPVSEVMTRDLVTCGPAATIATVCDCMLTAKIDCVPIVENGALIGIVTSSDLIALLRDQESAAEARLPFRFELREWAHVARSV